MLKGVGINIAMPRTTHRVGRICALQAVLPAGADAAQVDPIFADGFESAPLLHYLFDGDGVNIGTRSGYDMTVVGAGYDVGKFGQSLSFGTGGYGDVGGMRVAVGSLAKVTVGFWYYMSAPLSAQTIWSLDNNSTLPYGGIQVGESGSDASVCVSTTTSRYVSGSCGTFAAPPIGE
jgi:hypothetical protein